MPSKILVTGTGRSGTTFVASTLQRLGVSATHERVYQLNRRHQDWPNCDHVEVSWAAPAWRDIWPEDMTILHLVRHPLRVVESYLNVTNNVDNYLRNHWMLPEMLPALGLADKLDKVPLWSPTDWVTWHYISWNRLVERYAESRLKVEESVAIIQAIGLHLGQFWGPSQVKEAMGKANRNSVNAGRHTVTLGIICEELREPMRIIMEDYGYEEGS